jgi:hypothetical protein
MKTHIYFLSAIALLFYSCKSESEIRREIEKSLGLKLNQKIDEVKYYKVKLEPEYIYPYNEYIVLNGDRNVFQRLVTELNLVKNDSISVDSLLCLKRKNNYGYYSESFKGIRSINHPESVVLKTEKNIGWWKPNYDSKENTFVGYYNDRSNPKVVSCRGDWKGRLVIQYNDNKIFILIERFPSRTL